MEPIRIDIIPSKSFAHRAYICDFLGGGDGSGIVCELDSDDIRATKKCLESLALGSELLDAGESGSTLRFILPLAGAVGRSVKIKTRGRLSERPMGSLEDELKSHGMEISHDQDGMITASGKLTPGLYRLPGSVSSQFITGLLLSLPYLAGNSRIELTSELKSRAYVDITISVLADYGVSIDEHDGAYDIRGLQKYELDGAYIVEGDWSQAAFWLVAGLIGNKPVSISGLRKDSVQGDREIVNVLRKMGGSIDESVCESGYSVTAEPSKLHGEIIDVSEIPDLAPAIAAAACAAKGTTEMVNAGRLRLKESDRIESIVKCASQLGFDAYETTDSICINGIGNTNSILPSESRSCVEAETENDHRIVMMSAVLSLISGAKVEIKGSRAVSKSYPTFFDELESAGLCGNLIRK